MDDADETLTSSAAEKVPAACLQLSLNGGADWRPLALPARFRHGSCDRCSRARDPAKCRLHLHGLATQSPGAYSLHLRVPR